MTTVLHVAAVEYTIRRLLLSQLSALKERGFDVRVACAPEGKEFAESLRPFGPVELRFPRSPDPRRLASAARSLRQLLDGLRPAIVHFHTPAASLPGRALAALPAAHRPLIAQTVHGSRGLAGVERALSRITDLSLFVSAESLREAERLGHQGKLRFAGNGLAPEWFVDQVLPGVRTGPLRAIFSGRLVREKGIVELIDALPIDGRIHLTVAGDQLATDRDGVAEQVRARAAACAGTIELAGMVEPGEVRRLLRAADLFVLPSRREGLPLSVLEAMASGLPVIATDISGCRELVSDGENGWLIPPGDRGALREALQQAVAASPEVLLALGRASRARAEPYRLERTVDAVVAGYAELGVSGAGR
ncbi:MAG: glycosyltransferase [Actinomycetota bacterium]